MTYLAVLKMKINFCIHFECLFKSETSRAHMHQHWTGEEHILLFLACQCVCPGVKIWTNTVKHQRSMSQFLP